MTEKEIVCEACKKQPAHHVHHKDGNHRNNEPENLQNLCTLCHSKIHGISPKQSEIKEHVVVRDRAIKIRNALNNQIGGFGNIELFIPPIWLENQKHWDGIIKGEEKEIKKIMKNGDFKAWEWAQNVKGISYLTAAKLIAYIDINKTPTVSALWRYCGLDASHIKRTKKVSEEEAKKFGNPYLKKEMIGVLADSFIKQRTPIYREIYDREKERQIELHLQGGCERCTKLKLNKKPGHSHMRAKRKAVKIFLQHFWVAWRELEGLPVTEPYVQAKLGHKNMIKVPVMAKAKR